MKQIFLYLIFLYATQDLICNQNTQQYSFDTSGRGPLGWAATYGNVTEIKKLVSSGTPVDPQDDGLWTPLMCAVNAQHIAAAQLLLDKGADITLKNCWGHTALDIARARNILRLLRTQHNAS